MVAAALGNAVGALKQFRIADDRGQRRAQFVGDVADEVALQALGLGQGGGAVGQSALQVAGVGDVGEGDQGRAVRQGPALVDDDAVVRGADLARGRGAHLGIGIGHPPLQLAPEGQVVQARHAQLDHALEVAGRLQGVRRDVPERLERLVVQAQAAVRAEHRDGVVQLVQRGLLHLDQGVVLGLQAQLAGDVGIDQQHAAQRVRLAHHLQRAPVGQVPEVVGLGPQVLVAGELRGLPAGVVDGLGQAAALAQAVQHLAVGRPLGQPCRLQPPQLGEGGVVVRQPPRLAEDRHGLGDVVQGLVVGLDVFLEGVADVLDLGDVGAEHAHPAAFQRLRRQAERAPAAVQIDPAQSLAASVLALGALFHRLDHQGVGGAVEALAGQGGGRGRGRADRAQERLVAPHRLAVGVGDPARLDHAVEQGGETGGRRQAGLAAADRRQAQPGQGAGRPPLDRDPAAGAPRLERAGFAALEQGRKLLGVVRVGLGHGGDHRLDLGRDAQRLGADRKALGPGGQAGAAALDGDHGGVKGLDPGGRVQNVAALLDEPRLQRRDARLQTPALAQRPQGDADGEANRAARRREDQVVGSHQARRYPGGSSNQNPRLVRPWPEREHARRRGQGSFRQNTGWRLSPIALFGAS